MILFPIGVAFVFFTSVYLLALLRDDYSVVDIFWGLSFVVLATSLAVYRIVQDETLYWYQIVFIGAVYMWGLRLTLYLGVRNWFKGEDYRYVNMRKKWGNKAPKLQAYLKVYLLQAFFHLIIAITLIIAINNPLSELSTLSLIGLGVGSFLFLVGWLFETLGDTQLRQFKKDPQNKGKIMTRGVWSLTRHPNYFGEVVVWWSLWFITLSITGTIGWVGLISPLVITWLLLYVSGIPLLEKKYRDNPEFEAYKARTNAFFPGFPKK